MYAHRNSSWQAIAAIPKDVVPIDGPIAHIAHLGLLYTTVVTSCQTNRYYDELLLVLPTTYLLLSNCYAK